MEFSGPAPLGALAALAAEVPLRKALVDVKKVDPGTQSSGASTDSRQHPEQDVTASQARDIAEIRREMERFNRPAGPPPSFELSLLEVESDLKQVMARIETARAKARDAEALKADSPDRATEASGSVSQAQAAVAAASAEGTSAETSTET